MVGETVETVADLFFWALKSVWMVITAIKLKDAYTWEGKLGRTKEPLDESERGE